MYWGQDLASGFDARMNFADFKNEMRYKLLLFAIHFISMLLAKK